MQLASREVPMYEVPQDFDPHVLTEWQEVGSLKYQNPKVAAKALGQMYLQRFKTLRAEVRKPCARLHH